METLATCPRCGVTYRDRTVCPRCLVRLSPAGPATPATVAGVPAPAVHGPVDAGWERELPAPLVVLAVLHGAAAAAALRLLFGVLLEFHRSGGWPAWVVAPAAVYLSAVTAFCGFSCFGLLSRADWAEGETRRALLILMVLFPFGTAWGLAWRAYLKRLSRPAAILLTRPPHPPSPPPAPPAEPFGGVAP